MDVGLDSILGIRELVDVQIFLEVDAGYVARLYAVASTESCITRRFVSAGRFGN